MLCESLAGYFAGPTQYSYSGPWCDVQQCVNGAVGINITCSNECYLAGDWISPIEATTMNLGVAAGAAGALIVLSALFSGLTLGLMAGQFESCSMLGFRFVVKLAKLSSAKYQDTHSHWDLSEECLLQKLGFSARKSPTVCTRKAYRNITKCLAVLSDTR
eukprot:3544960-Pyramimonas_sp.AAC.1